MLLSPKMEDEAALGEGGIEAGIESQERISLH